jgi:hypothetical protein
MPSCTFTWCSRTVDGVMESIEARAYATEWAPLSIPLAELDEFLQHLPRRSAASCREGSL